jgi:hypothetical protein
MTIPPILAFGTEEQKQEWVVPAIADTKILCLGITEPDAGSDVAGIETRAVRDRDDYVLDPLTARRFGATPTASIRCARSDDFSSPSPSRWRRVAPIPDDRAPQEGLQT